MINEKTFFIPDKNRTYLSLKVFIVISVYVREYTESANIFLLYMCVSTPFLFTLTVI